MLYTYFLGLLLFFTQVCNGVEITSHHKPLNESHTELILTFSLQPDEILLKDFLNFALDTPEASITSWHTSVQPTSSFNPAFKESKLAYTGVIPFTIIIEHQPRALDATVYAYFILSPHKEIQERQFIVSLNSSSSSPTPSVLQLDKSSSPRTASYKKPSLRELVSATYHKALNRLLGIIQNARSVMGSLIQKTESLSIRLLLIFILGILLSLTPCIYPMIPITIGVLQPSKESTFLKNFLLAATYTIGVAMTFAIMGLCAAFFGGQCGQFMGNPLIILIIVLILGYLGLSMLDLYQMKIPKFLQPKNHSVKGGSYLSAFLFGAMSGMIASPCLSPGLALVLSIVATLGNKFLGFLMLFIFGIGSSMPLMIIGTFSSSLNMLPRAGMWMVEIKKVFGFMLLGMCIFYLNNILPWHLTLSLVSLLLLATGIYYIASSLKPGKHRLKAVIGFICLIMVPLSIFYTYKAYKTRDEKHSEWLSDYHTALEKARTENKKLLLDFGASWCSLCKQLEKKILHHPEVTSLFNEVVAVYVDCTSGKPAMCQSYHFQGYPTILLIDPVTGSVIKQWGSELIDTTPEKFAQELKSLLA